MNYEQEEEFLTNDLSRKLQQVEKRREGWGRGCYYLFLGLPGEIKDVMVHV